MEEITLSVFEHGAAATENLKKLIADFERQHPIRVRLEVISSWLQGWSRMVEIALYRNGPDVSEVGSTWVGDLARMMALRPFKPSEVESITAGKNLFKNTWGGLVVEDQESRVVYSVPWTGDIRLVFFRRDLLNQAGINETNAFQSVEDFDRTVSAIKAKGIPMPLVLPSRRSNLTLQNMASWVWGAGGEFLTPDGTGVAFDQPKALKGSQAYFQLGRYLNPEEYLLEEDESNARFASGKAAVALSGYWMLISTVLNPEVRENLGVAAVPGVPFVGGNDLIIWQHTRRESAAVQLVRFLHSESASALISPEFGLPVDENGWARPPFNSGFYPILETGFKKGRSFEGKLWGLVEKRMVDVLAEIWTESLGKPEAQIDEIVETRMIGLARRLQLSLET